MTRGATTIWIAPGATAFACLCERCLESRSAIEGSFLEALQVSVVRGKVALEADVAFAHCERGHEVVVRRVDRPPNLARRDAQQLELV
jgi:hypothetical protein